MSLPPFLQPAAGGPVYAAELDRALNVMIAGVTGIGDSSKVRPRWQLEPANQLDFTTDWVAFGVSRTERDTFAFQGFDPTGLTDDYVLQRDERLFTLISFYGPNGMTNAHLFCDGMQLSQNRAAANLAAINTTLVETQSPLNVSLQIKEKWIVRWDVMTDLRRRIERRYPIAAVESIELGLNNEFYITPLVIDGAP